MTNAEFVKKLIDIAENYKTLYVMGCFGAPMTAANKDRYCKNHSYNKQASRQKMIKAASADTFGFDCVNLIKGVLWGWNGDKKKAYGGASYGSNGVPDTNADGMIKLCSNVSKDFSKIEVGEAVWLSGHIGVYIGNGLAVECSPAFENKVQITAVKNIGTKAGYNARKWTKHGKLPYIAYTAKTEATEEFKKFTGYVTAAALNVRKGAGTNYGIYGTLKNGAAVTIEGESGDWYKITYSGKTAYISKTYISKTAPAVAPAVSYFKKYTGNSASIVTALKSIGATSSYAYRSKIAKANNIKLYAGTAAQNKKMLTLLKEGKLIKP
jgi:uncharacterized protein YraI